MTDNEKQDYVNFLLTHNAELKRQNAALVKTLKDAPRPMTSLTAEELKVNWKAVDHWFAIYDAWMDDVAKQALAQTK